MNVTLSMFQLKRLLTEQATIGAMRADEMRAKRAKFWSKNDVLRYLKEKDYPTTYLVQLEANGILEGKRDGARSNSRILYRPSDVYAAVQSIELSHIINQ